MRHGTNEWGTANEACHEWMRHVTNGMRHVTKSKRHFTNVANKWGMWRMPPIRHDTKWMRHVTNEWDVSRMNEACHKCRECGMSRKRPYNYRSLLQKSPIKETIFCKRELSCSLMSRMKDVTKWMRFVTKVVHINGVWMATISRLL